jgi:DNA-binding FadR family transcriptional regulator
MSNAAIRDLDIGFSPRSRHTQIVHHLGLSIVRMGAEGPGQSLPSEPELCVRLGVSRALLREAIKVLAAKGLVESRPKLGTVVRPRRAWNLLDPDILAWHGEAGPDEWLLRNLVEVRLIVEPQAARLAAARATEEDIAAMEAWCQRMHTTVDTRDAFIAADIRFHTVLLAAAHNDLLEQLIAAISAALRVSIKVTYGGGGVKASLPRHVTVVTAIRAHDADGAEAAVRDLIRATAEDIDRCLHEPRYHMGIHP